MPNNQPLGTAQTRTVLDQSRNEFSWKKLGWVALGPAGAIIVANQIHNEKQQTAQDAAALAAYQLQSQQQSQQQQQSIAAAPESLVASNPVPQTPTGPSATVYIAITVVVAAIIGVLVWKYVK
jgi:uncharacterized membrane protein YebE (DUF533 family)